MGVRHGSGDESVNLEASSSSVTEIYSLKAVCRVETANRNQNFFAISGLQQGLELLLWGPLPT